VRVELSVQQWWKEDEDCTCNGGLITWALISAKVHLALDSRTGRGGKRREKGRGEEMRSEGREG
jgi:hypothetical protein